MISFHTIVKGLKLEKYGRHNVIKSTQLKDYEISRSLPHVLQADLLQQPRVYATAFSKTVIFLLPPREPISES